MDVSRIEAISSKQIDWRKLTAPEIIEFKDQGVEVPTLYLQWAQEFMNDVNSKDKDETTYESAIFGTKSTTSKTESSEDDSEIPLYNKMSAAEYREEISKPTVNGSLSMTEIGIAFTDICKEKIPETEQSMSGAKSIENNSENTIEALEAYMSTLLSNINSAKEQLNAEKQNKKDMTHHSKVLRLQQQIKQYGETGQNVVASYGFSMDNLQQLLDGEKQIAASGMDYGSETINISKEMPADITNFIHKFNAKITGEKLVDKSEQAMDVQADVADSLDEKLDIISDARRQITDASGVGAVSSSEAGDSANSGEGGSSSSDAISISQNDGTEQSEKNSRTIDEILKAKIRKGENVGNEQST